MAEDVGDLARVLWATNRPGAGSLDDQPEAMQETYWRAADAALGWMVGAAIDPMSVVIRLAEDLAEKLAFKYNNPMGHFEDGIRETFDRYAELIGEDNLSDEIRKARQL